MAGSHTNDRSLNAADTDNARPRIRRRALSLLELAAVVAVLGLIAGMAVTRFGHDTLSAVDGEGVARRMSLALRLARRQAISEGVNAAVLLSRDAGAVASFTVVRAGPAGDEACEASTAVPSGVTITTAHDRWEFDFTGALVSPAGGTLTIDSTNWSWTITVNALTGQPALARSAI